MTLTDTSTNDELNRSIHSNKAINEHTISILYTNADCLNNKVSELSALAELNNLDIMCIAETLPKNILNRDNYINIEMEGYESLHSNTGRGVSIYVKEGIKYERIEFRTQFCDNIWVKLKVRGNYSILLGCVYRSPNSNQENNDALLRLLQKACNLNATCKVIMGDFNYKEVDWANGVVHTRENHPAAKTYDKVNDLFLHQLITTPTRFREGESENLLDWVLTDSIENIDKLSLLPPLGEKGDHSVIRFELDFGIDLTRYGDKFNYYNADYEAMKVEFDAINWETRLAEKSVNDAWNDFIDFTNNQIERHIPKRVSKRRKRKPWVDLDVRAAIKAKNLAWKEYKKNKSIENWESFKQIRNSTNRIVQSNKCKFENKLAQEIKTNPKQFWNYVRSKSKKSNSYPDLIDEGSNIISDDKQKANYFNEYFASVYTDEDKHFIPRLELRNKDKFLGTINFTPSLVEKQLSQLNTSKAAGPDNLHARVLNELSLHISKPLYIIFNKSLTEGRLPNAWKVANVKPLHKKGAKNQVSNYRPVSLTAICCKIMEKIIRSEIIKYLEENDFLAKDQHGFRSGRSCSTQLLETLELWSGFIENGMTVDCIYLDFAKAFDKVPHGRLINKLEAYGFNGNLLNWVRDFLNDRKQRVVINGISSNMESVTSGIPQGSVLGPTLFVIFINDLPETVKAYVKIFADDTKIFNAINSSDDNVILQEDIDNLVNWSKKWQLPFNMEKSKLVQYGRNIMQHTYYIEGNEIENVQSEKDLGVTFDSSLRFTSHINNITNKANSRLGMIKRNFTNLSKDIVLPLYKSLIRPILEYGSSIWNPKLKTDLIEIEKIQKRATKLIRNISHMSYPERLRYLNLDSLNFRRRRCDMIQVYRIIRKIDNLDMSHFFELSQSNTRGHRYKLKKPRVITTQRQHSFAMRIINDWNKLKDETVASTSINMFKTRLENEWKDHPERYFEN